MFVNSASKYTAVTLLNVMKHCCTVQWWGIIAWMIFVGLFKQS